MKLETKLVHFIPTPLPIITTTMEPLWCIITNKKSLLLDGCGCLQSYFLPSYAYFLLSVGCIVISPFAGRTSNHQHQQQANVCVCACVCCVRISWKRPGPLYSSIPFQFQLERPRDGWMDGLMGHGAVNGKPDRNLIILGSTSRINRQRRKMAEMGG